MEMVLSLQKDVVWPEELNLRLARVRASQIPFYNRG